MERIEKSTIGKDGTRSFEPNDSVWFRNYSGNAKWIPGTIIMKTGPASYKVKSNDQIYKRHVDQIKKRLTRKTLLSQLTISLFLNER